MRNVIRSRISNCDNDRQPERQYGHNSEIWNFKMFQITEATQRSVKVIDKRDSYITEEHTVIRLRHSMYTLRRSDEKLWPLWEEETPALNRIGDVDVLCSDNSNFTKDNLHRFWHRPTARQWPSRGKNHWPRRSVAPGWRSETSTSSTTTHKQRVHHFAAR